MLKLRKIGMKISGKKFYGVTNPSLIFGSNRRQYVRRRVGERWKNECLCPSVKHGGGSDLVWGCISASGVGDIVRIDGIMNAEKYRKVLIHHAIPSGKNLIANGFIFQHDTIPSTLLVIQDVQDKRVQYVQREVTLNTDFSFKSHFVLKILCFFYILYTFPVFSGCILIKTQK